MARMVQSAVHSGHWHLFDTVCSLLCLFIFPLSYSVLCMVKKNKTSAQKTVEIPPFFTASSRATCPLRIVSSIACSLCASHHMAPPFGVIGFVCPDALCCCSSCYFSLCIVGDAFSYSPTIP